jgi:hypothetical protein
MRSKKSTRSKGIIGAVTIGARNMGPWTISLVVCIVAAVVLIAAHQPSQSTVTTAKTQSAAQKTPAVRAQVATTAASKTPSVDADPKAFVPESATVTVTGCLEGDGQRFQLKDTTSADIPKARSWKSGFLKKGSPPIDVVDPASGLNLSSHVGQRVSVSGTLVDREMQVRSVRRVAASCD